MQLLQSSWSEASSKTVNNSFRKVAIYEEVVTKIDYQDDLFKDLSTDELEDTNNDV